MGRTTPLFDRHVSLGARMVEYAGWEMPVQYSGIVPEHLAVRERAGLFDVSHMGEIWVEGPAAADALAYALVSDPGQLSPGRCQYSMICAADGGIIDDLIVYRAEPQRFLVVANASNAAVVADELLGRCDAFDATVEDASARTSLIALQGPLARAILQPLTDLPLDDIGYYRAVEGKVSGFGALVSRTGYTGEDGFELFARWDDAPGLWDALMSAGETSGMLPCGLGARDTLRLEAGMPLYGNELDPATNPYEAGLGRVVRLGKGGDFVGRDALVTASNRGALKRRLAGLIVRGRGVARHGHPVFRPHEPEPCGVVTSGTVSPSTSLRIAMAYLPPREARACTEVEVGIRGSRFIAEVTNLPFYERRGRASGGRR